MQQSILRGLASSLCGMLIGAGWVVSQEPPTPTPAEPPVLLQAPVPAPPMTGFLIDGGAWLGVSLTDVTPEKARQLKLPGEYGAVVMRVDEESPAARAGLVRNDVILEFAGERIWSVATLQRLVRETPPGRTVTLKISRDGQTHTLSVKVERGGPHFKFRDNVFEMRLPKMEGFSFFKDFRTPSLGISGDDLTRQLADYFGVKQGRGVLVREVLAGSAAEKAGLKAGDVIVRVDGTEVGSVEELRRALPRDLEEKRKVTVSVVRDRREQTVTLELEPSAPYRLRQPEQARIPSIDLSDWTRLAAEYRRWARQYRQELGNYERELRDTYEEWQKNWRHEWEQQQRELKEEIDRELRQQLRSVKMI